MVVLSTLLTKGRVAQLVVPEDMIVKDYEILQKWLALLAEGAAYPPETEVDEYDKAWADMLQKYPAMITASEV